MSWTTVIWSAAGGIFLSLAGVHLLVWAKSRESWVNLVFAIAAVMAAIATLCELRMMHTQTPEAYGHWFRMLHIPVGMLVIALALFSRLYLGAGRGWLLWAVVATRVPVLVVNFLVRPNATFKEISGLQPLHVWGETVVIPIGTVRSWHYAAAGSGLLLLAFVTDASITAWRRGRRRQVVAIGGALGSAVILSLTISELNNYGLLKMPLSISLLFLIVVMVMAYELSLDLVRANQLAGVLRRTQERMDLATKSAGLSVWEWDVTRDDIWSNIAGPTRQAAGPRDGLTLEGALGTLHPDDRESTRAAVERSLATGDELEVEYRVVMPDGAARWLAVRGRTERDNVRKAVRMRGVAMDITQRKHAETAAAEREAELEHAARVGSLGELSATLAHELNQPLTAIISNAQAARRMLDPQPGNSAEVKEILDDIVGDGKRAGEIIHRMKDLIVARTHARERTDVRESVRMVAELLRGRLAEVEVSLSLLLPADLPAVEADPVGVQQVILNLMMNAIEAMASSEESARHLTVDVRVEGRMIVVRVRDTGPGIAPERASRVFSPFETTKTGGLGLGLAICRRIVETHGGKLWLENGSEPGATFCFALPVQAAQP